MGRSSRSVGRSVLIFFTAALVIAGYGCSMGLHSQTLVNPWLPAGTALAVAAATGLPGWRLWERLTGFDGMPLNYLCHMAVATAVVLASLYVCNYAFAEDEVREEYVTVERRYSEKRHRSKRVGRRSYGPGEAYKVYYLEVRFSDGRLKALDVPIRQFDRVRTGDRLTISLSDGLFGFPVMRSGSLSVGAGVRPRRG